MFDLFKLELRVSEIIGFLGSFDINFGKNYITRSHLNSRNRHPAKIRFVCEFAHQLVFMYIRTMDSEKISFSRVRTLSSVLL